MYREREREPIFRVLVFSTVAERPVLRGLRACVSVCQRWLRGLRRSSEC